MSDPVTHAEIEDVLSSIRRLVSEDTRQQPAAPEPAARLVLTPALRVQAPEAPVSRPAAAEPEAAAEPAADSGPVAGAAAEQVQEPDPEAGTETGALFPAAIPGAGDAAEPADPEDPADPEELAAQEPPLAFRHHREPSAARADSGGAQEAGKNQARPAAAAEAAGAEQAETDAPWGDPETTLFAAAAGASRGGDAPAGGDGPEPIVLAPELVRLKDEGLSAGTAGARAASVVRKIAEMEARSAAAQGRAQQHWEPDSQTEAPFAGAGPDTIEWRDEPVPARRGSRADDVWETAEDSDGTDLGGSDTGASEEAAVEEAVTGAAMDRLAEEGDSYLDEDSLRDLVASIVREELQGPLGERITRNVRKLVRREIHRALAAHDLL